MRGLVLIIAIVLTNQAWGVCNDIRCILSQQDISCKKASGGEVCVLPPSSLYSQPIAILIPSGTRIPQQAVLFLHGYLKGCDKRESASNPAYLVNEMGLLHQLNQFGQAAIMVMPMSEYCKGADFPKKCGDVRCDTHTNELVPNFSKILAHLEKVLKLRDTTWQVDAHSAGGIIAAKILSENPKFAKNVQSVGLMDASYCSDKVKPIWKRALRNGSFHVNARYISDPESRKNNHNLSSLDRFKVKPAWSNEHCAIPKREFGQLIDVGNQETTTETADSESTAPPVEPSEADH